MPTRKRAIEEVEQDDQQESSTIALPLLTKIRNMWEFANLMEYIYIFGDVVKISKDIDVETLETECCKPVTSDVLSQIGLALLKFVSSHRGLTPDLFDEFTRRQYDAKAPSRGNPFGKEEDPLKFNDFDVFLKIRILHQLSVWTLNNPDRIRQAFANENERSWCIEPLGWDREDRTYYSLDDNRLYRMTDAPAVEPAKRKTTKIPSRPKARGSRSSKRQRISSRAPEDVDVDGPDADEIEISPVGATEPEEPNNALGLGGANWECVAITLKEYKDFAERLHKTKDPNEKILYRRLVEEVMPVIADMAAAQERKAAQKRRELENLEKLAMAKRSSRIAGKHEKLKEQQEEEEAERKRQEERAKARMEEEKQKKMEEARESRMEKREQRLKDREVKRILHEQELARLESQSQDGDSADARISERRRRNELERKKRELEEFKETDEEWYFDCSVCGVHGKNLDDGTHVLACEKCNVWQHSACHSIKEEEADSDDFHFLCASCLKPPKPIKLNMGSASSPSEAKKKKKRQEKLQVRGNGALAAETKRKKKKPKSQLAHLNGSSPEILSPYESVMQTDLVAVRHAPTHPSMPGSFYPPQGHFLNPANGHASGPSDPALSHHEVKYPPNQSNAAVVAGDNNSPFHLPASGAQTASVSNVTWSTQSRNGMSNAGHRTPHNPYHNDFGRQRISPYSHAHKSPPSSSLSNSGLAEPINNSQGQNPHTPQLPPITASPTPSFSATQGNTDVRFSPMKRDGHPTSIEESGRSPKVNSYMPDVNGSKSAAVSPVKHSSSPPPPLPHPSSSQADGGAAVETGFPTFNSPTVTSTAGISPIKQETAPTMPLLPSDHAFSVTGPNTLENSALSAQNKLQTDIKHTSTMIPPAHPGPVPQKDPIAFHHTTSPLASHERNNAIGREVDRSITEHVSRVIDQPSSLPGTNSSAMGVVLPAPTLSPSVGLNGVIRQPEKENSPPPSTLPIEAAGLSPNQSNPLPTAPTLSPSVGLNAGVETPYKKQTAKSQVDAQGQADEGS